MIVSFLIGGAVIVLILALLVILAPYLYDKLHEHGFKKPNGHLKLGDVVRNEFNGRPMTVDAITNDGIECVWHEQGEGCREIFQPQQLYMVRGGEICKVYVAS
jgi:uncharacterized protein YodC (DUF2158 family)